MAKLLGKWKHESNVKMEEFMVEMEMMPADKLKKVMAEADQWTLEVKKEGNEWVVTEWAPTTGTHSFKFESGKPFMEKDDMGDTGEYESVATVDSDTKITQKHFIKAEDNKTIQSTITTIREVKSDGKLHITVKAPDMKTSESSAIYKRA